MKKKILSVFCCLLCMVFVCTSAFTAFAASPTFGVDVSYANGSAVSFTDFKNQNKKFVMIRLGYFTYLDNEFWNNVQKANEAGMPFGVYLYSYAYSLDEANQEAQFVLSVLSQLKNYEYFLLPVAYDLEESKMAQYGKTQITNQAVAFCDTIRAAGYMPMIYANLNWYNNYLNLPVLKNKGYKFWYANWSLNTSDFSSPVQIGNSGITADMWQYTDNDSVFPNTDANVIWDITSLCRHHYTTSITPATASKDGKVAKYCKFCNSTTTSAVPKIKSAALSSASYTYDGKVKKPSVTVKDSKGKTVSSKYYTVTYASGRKNVGQYTVTIKFKGNYSGTLKRTFTIKPKSASISKVTAGSKKLTVKWKKQATQTTGYQIQYSTDKNFKKNNKTVTVSKNKTTTKTISKLKGKKKYYVRIRTYKTVKVSGKSTKIYSSWSKAKSITTKK